MVHRRFFLQYHTFTEFAIQEKRHQLRKIWLSKIHFLVLSHFLRNSNRKNQKSLLTSVFIEFYKDLKKVHETTENNQY